jgi:hypothetical protein
MAAATLVGGAASLAGWLIGLGSGLGLVGTLVMAQIAATFLCTGVLGEYVGRTYWESKRRPLFAIEETCNLPGSNADNRIPDNPQMALLHSYVNSGRARTGSCSQEHCHAA